MPLIHVKTARVEYKFEIHNKYTVIKGDSGSGKTTFYDLINVMGANPKAVQNVSGEKIIAIPAKFEDFNIANYSDVIFVVDENCTLFKRSDVASILRESENYFIIINREINLGYLPIHVDNVYRMKTAGKFHSLERIYKRFELSQIVDVDTIIVEDKRSGYLFVQDMLGDCDTDTVVIEPAYGNAEERLKDKNAGASKVAKSMEYHAERGRRHIFVVYDAAAFGVYMDLLWNVIRRYPKVQFYILDWDSFENYILKSKVYQQEIRLEDADYHYESYETYSTQKLGELIAGYSKTTLHKCLKRERCVDCKDVAGCEYKKYTYDDLIYDGMKKLYDCVKHRNTVEL